jgi:hypothetical protein
MRQAALDQRVTGRTAVWIMPVLSAAVVEEGGALGHAADDSGEVLDRRPRGPAGGVGTTHQPEVERSRRFDEGVARTPERIPRDAPPLRSQREGPLEELIHLHPLLDAQVHHDTRSSLT